MKFYHPANDPELDQAIWGRAPDNDGLCTECNKYNHGLYVTEGGLYIAGCPNCLAERLGKLRVSRGSLSYPMLMLEQEAIAERKYQDKNKYSESTGVVGDDDVSLSCHDQINNQNATRSKTYLFKLCEQCISQYNELQYKPDSYISLCFMPFPTIIWSDEHPDGRPSSVKHNGQCNDWMNYLLIARNYLWEHGSISDDYRPIWEEAQLLIPNWSGFKRLSLNDDQMESYRCSIAENKDMQDVEALYNAEITITNIAPGYVKRTALIRAPKR